MDTTVVVDGVLLTSLRILSAPGGDVLHAMKRTEAGFRGFGEAYFSKVQSGSIKGWKRHRNMTLNLVVPVGAVKFVIYDDRVESATQGKFFAVTLSNSNYQRLTLPPMIWFAFQGVYHSESMLLNIASIPHDPDEVDQREIDDIEFDWESS